MIKVKRHRNRNFLFAFFLLACSCSTTRQPKTVIWDKDGLCSFRTDGLYNDGINIQDIKNTCDLIIKELPVTVTNKDRSFAPDMHYYCSVGPYWWLDSLSGKYVVKDGYVNPEYYKYDVKRLSILESRCVNLSLAFYYSGDLKYYNAFSNLLNTWFCAPQTLMYPNFKYAQVVPGENNNKGHSYGIIEASSFNGILDSIRLVNSKKSLNRRLLKYLKKWFEEFVLWMDYGDFGEELKKTDNNIGIAYDVIRANMYLFINNKVRASQICNDFVQNRLQVQINEKGEQPQELRRTKAFSYSVFNLGNIVDLIQISQSCHIKDEKALFERTEKAFIYLSRYIGHKEEFPYSEISDWEECERAFNKNWSRFCQQKNSLIK